MVEPIKAQLVLDVVGGPLAGAGNGGGQAGGAMGAILGQGLGAITRQVVPLLKGAIASLGKIAVVTAIVAALLKPLQGPLLLIASILQVIAFIILKPIANLLNAFLKPVLVLLLKFLIGSGLLDLFDDGVAAEDLETPSGDTLGQEMLENLLLGPLAGIEEILALFALLTEEGTVLGDALRFIAEGQRLVTDALVTGLSIITGFSLAASVFDMVKDAFTRLFDAIRDTSGFDSVLDYLVEIGKVIVAGLVSPVLGAVAAFNFVKEMFSNIAGNSEMFQRLSDTAADFKDRFLDMFDTVVDIIFELFGPGIQGYIMQFASTLRSFWNETVVSYVSTFGDWISNFFLNTLPGVAQRGFDFISTLFEGVYTVASDVFSRTVSAIADAIDSIGDALGDIIDYIADFIDDITDIASDVARSIGGGISSTAKGLWDSFTSFFADDVLITSNGEMIRFNPEDDILASKNGFANTPAGGGGSTAITINVSALDASGINSSLARSLAEQISQVLKSQQSGRRTYNLQI